MLGCLIGDHVRHRSQPSEGVVIMMAVTDVLLSKLVWEQLRSDEESDALYQSRFQYFIEHSCYKQINLQSWVSISAIPIGFSAQSLDEAQQEAIRCARMMTEQPNKIKEAQIIASLVFLGKEGVASNAIPYFLKAEYNINIEKMQSTLGRAINQLLGSSDFESYLMDSRTSHRIAYTLLCGGLGQAFLAPMSQKMVDETLDVMLEDYKRITLSFHKTYDLKF